MKRFQPVKPINFNPNPKSQDPLKWNFMRGLDDRKPLNGIIGGGKTYSLPDRNQHYANSKHARSFRNLLDAQKPSALASPFATYGKSEI